MASQSMSLDRLRPPQRVASGSVGLSLVFFAIAGAYGAILGYEESLYDTGTLCKAPEPRSELRGFTIGLCSAMICFGIVAAFASLLGAPVVPLSLDDIGATVDRSADREDAESSAPRGGASAIVSDHWWPATLVLQMATAAFLCTWVPLRGFSLFPPLATGPSEAIAASCHPAFTTLLHWLTSAHYALAATFLIIVVVITAVKALRRAWQDAQLPESVEELSKLTGLEGEQDDSAPPPRPTPIGTFAPRARDVRVPGAPPSTVSRSRSKDSSSGSDPRTGPARRRPHYPAEFGGGGGGGRNGGGPITSGSSARFAPPFLAGDADVDLFAEARPAAMSAAAEPAAVAEPVAVAVAGTASTTGAPAPAAGPSGILVAAGERGRSRAGLRVRVVEP